ncbi:MAG: alpha/beta fold hydrolase [Pseudomonadota bacterium]
MQETLRETKRPSSTDPFEHLRVPVFKPRAPWWGGDLQTMRNQFAARFQPFDSITQRLEFPLPHGAGDRMLGMLETPSNFQGGPLIILVHGLTGCEDSAYIREGAHFHLKRGRRILRLNLRGAGPSRSTCGGYYFAGCTEDIRAVIAGIPSEVKSDGIIAVGFSLGGNILLNCLAQDWAEDAFLSAATVCAPIRPAQAARRIMETRNWIYHRFLLQRMKEDTMVPDAALNDQERAAIASSKSIYEFDDKFTAPHNGYADADDYYARTAGAEFVADIKTPTLLIHAHNDPWIPVAPYYDLEQVDLRRARIVIAPGGGHVGFHGRELDGTWHDVVINSFVAPHYG